MKPDTARRREDPDDDAIRAVFDAERDRAGRLTKKGIGMPLAGCLYWLAVTFLVHRFKPQSAMVLSFAVTGVVFPVGALLTRAFGGNLFAKSPALTSLGILLAAVQIFYWPIIIVVFRQAVDWTPFCLAILFGSHFLPYAWLYRSRAYAFLGISTTVAVTAAALITRSPVFKEAPVIAAFCYLVSVVMLWREVKTAA